MTGADSAEMGQGGIRVNMVPKDGGNAFHGVVLRQLRAEGVGVGQLRFTRRRRRPCTRHELAGDLTFNPNNKLTNVSVLDKIWDINPSIGGPIAKDKVWFYATYRYWGVNKTIADSFFDADPSPFRYAPDLTRQGIDDGHIRSIAGRVSAQITQQGQDLLLPRRSEQGARPLGHRGQHPARSVGDSGDADQLRVGVEVDAHAHQQAAVRRRPRRLRPGIPGELSAGGVRRHRSRW